jgi:predicted aspartyl protease
MIFYYQPIISAAPDGNYQIVLRPEIPVTVIGPTGKATYSGLVDTGSDNTILPKSVAHQLGIALVPAAGPPATVFGGHRVQLLVGDVTLELEADTEVARWQTQIYFFDFAHEEDETVILGHMGFLDYFTATFDGKLGSLTLVPNDELPLLL